MLHHYQTVYTAKADDYVHHMLGAASSVDIEYGFHGTNAWEQWQLLLFYRRVFQHRDFDVQRIRWAKRGGSQETLDISLESLAPGLRNKLWNRYLSDAKFFLC